MYHPKGVIHDGLGNYSVGVKCSWLIDTSDLQWNQQGNKRPPTIRMHLREFATECGWDHLYIYDGDSVDSPLLAVFRYIFSLRKFFIRFIINNLHY